MKGLHTGANESVIRIPGNLCCRILGLQCVLDVRHKCGSAARDAIQDESFEKVVLTFDTGSSWYEIFFNSTRRRSALAGAMYTASESTAGGGPMTQTAVRRWLGVCT